MLAYYFKEIGPPSLWYRLTVRDAVLAWVKVNSRTAIIFFINFDGTVGTIDEV